MFDTKPVGALGSNNDLATMPVEALGFNEADEARAVRGRSRARNKHKEPVARKSETGEDNKCVPVPERSDYLGELRRQKKAGAASLP